MFKKNYIFIFTSSYLLYDIIWIIKIKSKILIIYWVNHRENMSAYDKLARLEDEAQEDEFVESQIEQLTQLQEYDYFWNKFGLLWCDNRDFTNKKWGLVNSVNKKVKHEARCWWYLLLLPFIFIVAVLRLLKRTITWLIVRPNGK